MRAAWDKLRDNLGRGMCLHILNCSWSPTGVAPTGADTQQAFVDILVNDVIKPLEMLKVSQEYIFWQSFLF